MTKEARRLALEKIADALPAYIDGVAAREYLTVIHKALAEQPAQQEHPEQMARLGWQYVECPACGSEGARAFPKPSEQGATMSKEVLRLSKDGIWANPDIPADEAAKLVLAAIDFNIKVLVDKAVEAEREACAKVCENGVDTEHPTVKGHIMKDFGQSRLLATAIRARSNT